MQFIRCYAGLSGKRVVDVGCGGGILSEALALAGADVTGIDLGGDLLAVAGEHAKASGLAIDYQQSSVEALAAEHAGSFDHVTCMEMLEHVPDPASVVSACVALVKPGGRIFFSTLNRRLKAYLLAIVGAEYLLNMIPRGTHDFSTFIRPSELVALTRQFSLNPKDLDVNYLAAFEKPVS
jgi:2-polyprenyl-6-hydroxyphenyl methylase/3-demethylubiquinone-9 3-methyltransferase